MVSFKVAVFKDGHREHVYLYTKVFSCDGQYSFMTENGDEYVYDSKRNTFYKLRSNGVYKYTEEIERLEEI